MKSLTRREFVKSAVASATSAGFLQGIQASPSAILDSNLINMADTGIKVSKLAMGTGFNGFGGASNQTKLGNAEFKKLIFHGFDRGLNFLDMADQYGSHYYMREVLKNLPSRLSDFG